MSAVEKTWKGRPKPVGRNERRVTRNNGQAEPQGRGPGIDASLKQSIDRWSREPAVGTVGAACRQLQ